MGLVGSIGKAAGAVAKFCDDYNVVVRSRSSPPTCIHLTRKLKTNPKNTQLTRRLSPLTDTGRHALRADPRDHHYRHVHHPQAHTRAAPHPSLTRIVLH